MTQQRYAIRLADGALAETEGEIDTWTTRGEAEYIRRGDYTYSEHDREDLICIEMADSHGNLHPVGWIDGQPGDWQEIIDGADPVADGWEDGNGHTVSAVVDMDRIVKYIRSKLKDDYDLSYWDVLDDILDTNDNVGWQQEYNGLADDYDLDYYVQMYRDYKPIEEVTE